MKFLQKMRKEVIASDFLLLFWEVINIFVVPVEKFSAENRGAKDGNRGFRIRSRSSASYTLTEIWVHH